MAFFILAAYAIFASMWMFYLTDGDVRKLQLVMAGAGTLAPGVWLAIFLAKRKKKEHGNGSQ